MIYPNNFEHKIGFDDIRTLLKERCQSSLGRNMVDEITFSSDAAEVNEWMQQANEFRRLKETTDDFPMQYFFDMRESVARIRLAGTHLEENEVFDLRRSLETISNIVIYLNKGNASENDEKVTYTYPALQRLTTDIMTFPAMIRRIDSILDKYGKIKDGASMTLASIRHELSKTEGSISRTLYTILHAAQRDGLVDKDAAPTMRDGRLMIPVAPGLKRKINGIVHDESATGKTVFIEPAEVVEANNRVRELEAEERREVIRILTVFTDEVRPHVKEILDSYRFLAIIDLIQAKTAFAELTKAFEPKVENKPHIDWIRAIHPLLALSLEKQGKKVVPLDILLEQDKRLLIISGPNAGGKSVCLKTVGLLQYMLQCGLPIPIGDRSTCGIFQNIMIDIGDEQSIEDDLSTYSSHLMNMKQMIKNCDAHTILLIDEFGGGTEPMIGGAIAEAVLKQFWQKKTFGVITTHYQNLKHFADDHEGVVNGAMLYDRHQMQALFQLSIGQPGSSFAIEIARKTGLPEEVIKDASDIVGSEYIQSDKYLQDIVRDKRYWEGKRQTIHQHEKNLEGHIQRYESNLEEIERERKQILKRAQQQAEELLAEANRKIENAIREIKEAQAEKERTREIREELQEFRQQVQNDDTRGLMSEEDFAKKLRQMEERKARKAQRKADKAKKEEENEKRQQTFGAERSNANDINRPLQKGDTVRIKGLNTIGTIESIQGKQVTVIFGDVRTKMKAEQLERCERGKAKNEEATAANKHASLAIQTSKMTRATMEDRKYNFHQDIDVRGMRGDEAIDAVMHFIDDAILIGMSRVRILHGTGSGILRQLIRQYLNTIPNVSHFRDEHVQFGGAGITVVDIE
ncbi:endonuclease MutS2 [Prevotella sp. E2-28]|uniref:endonuclease MutS2 n=1 Tax=Prevotella sp. E2-28 TaxID=2913620 RepID=UPI001EDAD5F1|nr:Smr/MutS family protein [Prevotella sp. E2-28]UKK53384.1 Smr/MutS family protein [Prevotella sp. E2-28]